MFLKFYGLREQPFGVTPNPRFLYQSPTHREALASLVYAIENDLGFTALVAEPGMGKTTLLFHVLELFRDSAQTAFVFHTQCTSNELLRYLLADLGVTTADTDPVVLHEEFKQVLLRESRQGRRVLIVIDEAQNLKPSVLETIRLLSDFETPEFKLLHIILSGQPALAGLLARPELCQLTQRVTILNRLTPFTMEETRQYIEHRLYIAGCVTPALFTREAYESIARITGGVPREINRLCFNALSLGCALQKRTIDAAIVAEVDSDLDLNPLLKRRDRTPREVKPVESAGRGVAMVPSESEYVLLSAPRQSPAPQVAPMTMALLSATPVVPESPVRNPEPQCRPQVNPDIRGEPQVKGSQAPQEGQTRLDDDSIRMRDPLGMGLKPRPATNRRNLLYEFSAAGLVLAMLLWIIAYLVARYPTLFH
ncbi:MAG: AAA family ATPase [Terriglobales bacterium]